MITLDLATTAQLLGINKPRANPNFKGVCIDSRLLQPGELFIALTGEQTDGHRFLHEVQVKGAAAALISQPCQLDLPCLQVPNTLTALGELAHAWRQRYSIPVIATTGSNGKTTTRSMVTAILRAASSDKQVLSPQGNYNTLSGLPLTLFKLSSNHRYASLEMGMNHLHEISRMTEIAQPSVGIITNAAAAHIEFLKNVETVAKAKGELFSGLPSTSYGIVNADDPFADYWLSLLEQRPFLRFSLKKADVYPTLLTDNDKNRFILHTPDGDIDITLPIPGLHNIANALAASAACISLHIPLPAIKQGLESMQGIKQRLQHRTSANGINIIDDTYNANPASTRAALAVLACKPGKKIWVFGDMGELGPDSERLHKELGLLASQLAIDVVFTVGQHSAATSGAFSRHAQHFSTKNQLLAAIQPLLDENTTVLIKGSRFMRMEEIADALFIEKLSRGLPRDYEGKL